MTELQVEKLVAPEMPIVVRSRVRDPRQPLDVRWAYPLLLAVSVFFLLLRHHSGDLWRTENLRALIAAEFLRSGDWIVPRLYGEPYLTKPPGMYAAIALASWPMGEVRTWSARLPSALAATITVFLFYCTSRRVLGRSGGLAAALVLPLSLIWLDKAGVAEIDMLQVAWVTGDSVLLRALEEESYAVSIIVLAGCQETAAWLAHISASTPPDNQRMTWQISAGGVYGPTMADVSGPHKQGIVLRPMPDQIFPQADFATAMAYTKSRCIRNRPGPRSSVQRSWDCTQYWKAVRTQRGLDECQTAE